MLILNMVLITEQISLIWGSLHKSWQIFFGPKCGKSETEVYTFKSAWSVLADANTQVSLVWRKKTKHLLNQSFVVLVRHTEENMEDRQHKILIPTFNNLQSSPHSYLCNSTILDKDEW